MSGTRERLVGATVEQLRRHGYHGTSLKTVTAAAGAPVGSLYHFFPEGKTQLVAAALTDAGESYRQLFEVIAADAATTADAVEAFFSGAADALEETDYLDLCPIGTVGGEIASSDDELRRVAHAVFVSWTDTLASRLVSDGVASADATNLAATIISMLEGGFILARCARDTMGLRVSGQHARALVDRAMTVTPLA